MASRILYYASAMRDSLYGQTCTKLLLFQSSSLFSAKSQWVGRGAAKSWQAVTLAFKGLVYGSREITTLLYMVFPHPSMPTIYAYVRIIDVITRDC